MIELSPIVACICEDGAETAIFMRKFQSSRSSSKAAQGTKVCEQAERLRPYEKDSE